MIRIALNTLYDPDEYPVDIAELMSLRAEHLHIARGFLSNCATDPTLFQSWPPEQTRSLQSEVDGGREDD